MFIAPRITHTPLRSEERTEPRLLGTSQFRSSNEAGAEEGFHAINMSPSGARQGY